MTDADDCVLVTWARRDGSRRRIRFEPELTDGWIRHVERWDSDQGAWLPVGVEHVESVTLIEPEVSR